MLVKDWMNKPVITVDVNDSMQTAMKLMKEHGIRMLPVLKNGKLKGFNSASCWQTDPVLLKM